MDEPIIAIIAAITKSSCHGLPHGAFSRDLNGMVIKISVVKVVVYRNQQAEPSFTRVGANDRHRIVATLNCPGAGIVKLGIVNHRMIRLATDADAAIPKVPKHW